MDPEGKQMPSSKWLSVAAYSNHCGTGAPFDRDYELETLKGLLMIGHLDIDPEGKHLPWPIPVNGLGNGAHLATTDLRCSPGGPHDKAAPSGPKTRLARS